MQFMVYFAVREGDPQGPPSGENMAELGKLMQEGMESGLIVATGQLPSTVSRIELSGPDTPSITDGPFVEGKELIPGFTIIEVSSKQEAIEWTTRLGRLLEKPEMRIAQLYRPGME